MKNVNRIIQIVFVAFLSAQESVTAFCPLDCYNGGECVYVEESADYFCKCPMSRNGVTFVGIRCETPAITCTSNSGTCLEWQCLNDGLCAGSEDFCTCPDGFSGTFCEDGPVKCMYGTTMCRNGGTCVDLHFKQVSECSCPVSTKGDECEKITNRQDFMEEMEGISSINQFESPCDVTFTEFSAAFSLSGSFMIALATTAFAIAIFAETS